MSKSLRSWVQPSLARLSSVPEELKRATAIVGLAVVAVFSTSLWFVPGDIDDVLLFSSVDRTPHPFRYFAADVGLGKNEFRPLHAAASWVLQRAFGVMAAPQQALNLGLHLANTLLLLHLLHRITNGSVLGTLLSLVFAVSPYVVSPATWISDRPTLIVGLAVLLLWFHLDTVIRTGSRVSPWLLGAASMLALLGKESGLLFAVWGIGLAVVIPTPARARLRLVGVSVVLAGFYLVWRTVIFGEAATRYVETGMILGNMRYEGIQTLPGPLRVYAFAENVLKGLIGFLVPVFDNQGGFQLFEPRGIGVVFLLGSVVLGLATAGLALPLHARVALLLGVANAAVHFSVFRHRTLYVAALAGCLWVASVCRVDASPWRKRAAAAGASIVIICSLFLSTYRIAQLADARWRSVRDLENATSPAVVGDASARVSRDVLEQIRRRYAP